MKILSTILRCTRLWEVKAIKTPILIRVSLNREMQAKDGISDVLPEVLPFVVYSNKCSDLHELYQEYGFLRYSHFLHISD
jgi:hypothetical protein